MEDRSQEVGDPWEEGVPPWTSVEGQRMLVPVPVSTEDVAVARGLQKAFAKREGKTDASRT